jgi:TRAP-type mannitol/chloroaromatic compound transport system permease large subunit
VSFMVAGVVCAGVVLADGVMEARGESVRGGDLALAGGFIVGFCVLGWVVSVPLVLWVSEARRGRFWVCWIAGSLIGPLLMIAVFWLDFVLVPGDPHAQWLGPERWPLIYLAGAISGLAALGYLLLLRRGRAA